jgi:peptide/nickel transport system permease protein
MTTEPDLLTSSNKDVNHSDASVAADAAATRIFVAPQWKLMWWRFRKHKLAVASSFVIITLYIVAIFAEPLAPYSPQKYNSKYTYAPPQRIHCFDERGRFVGPYVYALKQEIEPQALRRVFAPDLERKIRLGLFVRGDRYRMWGIIDSDIHLFGPVNHQSGDGPVYLLGADRLGRDVLSRIIYGTRISMSIGLVGVGVSLFLGTLLGGISGYFGGLIDEFVQRLIEFLRSIPTIPLWMGLAAAVPPNWPSVRIYFSITLILSLIGWTGLARVVRGRFLSLREEDFIMAARLAGASELRVILRHMVPSFYSHIIAAVTLAIPGMILSETALSFLGLGLQPPVVSWGVLLQDSQNVRAISSAPWLLFPALAVITAVLALNFLGDGLRDAVDPYSR